MTKSFDVPACSLEQVVECCESDSVEEDEGATYLSKAPVPRLGCFQLADFCHDLRPSNLAKRISAVVGRVGIWGVGMHPIKQLNDPQFLVQTCQAVSLQPHMGLLTQNVTCFGKTQSNCVLNSV